MTWHQIFSLKTLESRHLLAAYADVLLLQGGYFLWIAYQWSRTKPPRE
jgi:hypothetical protein